MGGTISLEFRQAFQKCLQTYVPLDDRVTSTTSVTSITPLALWQVLFRTEMSNDDFGAYSPISDFRLMKVKQPATFANVIYMCIRQLALFLEVRCGVTPGQPGTAAGAAVDPNKKPNAWKSWTGKIMGGTIDNGITTAVDDTGAMNALRLLAVALPIAMEDDATTATGVATEVSSSSSDAAAPFPFDAWKFFELNLRPATAEEFKKRRVESVPMPSVWSSGVREALGGAGTTGDALGDDLPQQGPRPPVALGKELINVLTAALLLPGFSCPGVAHASLLQSTFDELITCVRPWQVNSEFLYCGGIGTQHGFPAAHSSMYHLQGYYLARRFQTIRTLLSALAGAAVSRPFEARTASTGVSSTVAAATAVPEKGFQATAGTMLTRYFMDGHSVPLSTTALAGMINFVATYNARGFLPFTSHYSAELPEAVLAETLMAIGVIATLKPAYILSSSSSRLPTTGEGAVGAFWKLMENIRTDSPKDLTFLWDGFLAIVEIPIYATQTVLKGSQRVVECTEEAFVALWALLVSSPSCRDAFVSYTTSDVKLLSRTVESLLFCISKSQEARQFFGLINVALNLLLLLTERSGSESVASTTTSAAATSGTASESEPVGAGSTARTNVWSSLCSVKPSRVFIVGFPNLSSPGGVDASLVDVLITIMCDLMSPSVPMWCHAFSTTCACILLNVLPWGSEVAEGVGFELYHLLDYVSSDDFLFPPFQHGGAAVIVKKDDATGADDASAAPSETSNEIPSTSLTPAQEAKQRAILQRCQETCITVCDAIVMFAYYQRTAAASLVASLATKNIPMVLTDAIDGTRRATKPAVAVRLAGNIEGAAEMQPVATRAAISKLPPDVASRLPISRLQELTAVAQRSIVSVDTPLQDPTLAYTELLKVQLALPPPPRAIRKLEVPEELKRWSSGNVWALIHRRHGRPPLFDNITLPPLLAG